MNEEETQVKNTTDTQPTKTGDERKNVEAPQNEENQENAEQKNVAMNGQSQNTEQNKIAWQVKADELAKRIDGTLFVQLAYRSDAQHKCDPVLLSEKQTANIYPIVVDAPVGLIDPVFDYGKNVWIENSTKGIATLVAGLSADVAKIKDYEETETKNKQVDDKKNDQAIKLMTMISTQMGILNAKVDKISKSATTNPEPDAKTSTETDKLAQPVEGGNE